MFLQCLTARSRSWSAAAAGGAAGVALLAGAVAHHCEVLALGAHVAGVTLHDRAGAAFGFELLGVRLGRCRFCGRLVGEQSRHFRYRLDCFLGDLFGKFGGALFVVALEGNDFRSCDRRCLFDLADGVAGNRGYRCTGGGAGRGCCRRTLRLTGAISRAADDGRLVAAGPAGGDQVRSCLPGYPCRAPCC